MKTKIVDRWVRPDGEHKARYGKGKRFLARWEHEGERGSKAFDRKRPAENWLANEAWQEARRHTLDGSQQTVAEWMDRWYDSHSQRVQSNTAYQYRMAIDTHIAPALGAITLIDLTDDHVDKLYQQMRSKSPTQIPRVHTVLNQALRMAVKEGLIERNPMAVVVKPKGVHRRQGRQGKVAVLSPAQVRQVAESLRPTDRMIFQVLLETGMRPAEMAALAAESVDWDRRIIHITHSLRQDGVLAPPKTGVAREVPLSKNVADILSQCVETAAPIEVPAAPALAVGDTTTRSFLLPHQNETHYDRPLAHHRWGVNRFKPALDKVVNIPGQNVYITRHTYASSLIKAGLNVKRVSTLMGHSTVTLTLNTYSHLFDGDDWDDVTDHFASIY